MPRWSNPKKPHFDYWNTRNKSVTLLKHYSKEGKKKTPQDPSTESSFDRNPFSRGNETRLRIKINQRTISKARTSRKATNVCIASTWNRGAGENADRLERSSRIEISRLQWEWTDKHSAKICSTFLWKPLKSKAIWLEVDFLASSYPPPEGWTSRFISKIEDTKKRKTDDAKRRSQRKENKIK